MHWEKKICVRLTIRRIVVAILAASTVANLVIVGVVFGADSLTATPTVTSVLPTPLSTNAFLIPVSGIGEAPTLTEIPGVTPIDTFTPTPTSTDSPIWMVCIKRFYWPTYRVQPGDTLFSLASAVGSTVTELVSANCLTNDHIYAGQVLYVPRLLSDRITSTSTSTSIATPTATQTPTDTSTPIPTETPSVTPTNTPTITPSSTPVPAADLVVTIFQLAGSPQIPAGQRGIIVPIYVIVQNQGESAADIFKLSAQYIDLNGKFTAPFSISGQSNEWYPYTRAPLARGEQTEFRGFVWLPETLQGQTISLTVFADSCSGDEAMPGYCRVMESKEDNNESQPIAINLPSNSPPVVSITIPDADTIGSFNQDPKQNTNDWSAVVELSGSAIDPEDGVLTGSSLVWSTDRTDLDIYKNNPILGTGTSISPTLYVLPYDCRGHIVTLTATDSDGNVVIVTRKIDIACIN